MRKSIVDQARSWVRVIVTLGLVAAWVFMPEDVASRIGTATEMVIAFWFAERLATRAAQNGNNHP